MGNISLKEQLNQLPPELKGIIRKYTINICISCQNKLNRIYLLHQAKKHTFDKTMF